MSKKDQVIVETFFESADETIVLWGVTFKSKDFKKHSGEYVATIDKLDAKEMVEAKRVKIVKTIKAPASEIPPPTPPKAGE